MKTSLYRIVSAGLIFVGANFSALNAAVYQEIGGQAVIEAEHFDTRTVDTSDNHHWHVVPDDNTNPNDPLKDTPATYSETLWLNARGGKYVQSYPDSAGGGQNKNTDTSVVGTDPVLNYKVKIDTTGKYRLYLRFAGYDGSSDSIYAQIVELIDGLANGQPDWYRYVGAPAAPDFSLITDTAGGSAVGWNGNGAPEGDAANQIGGGGGEIPAYWTIATAGTYTIRISQREDGSAVDALILQLATLPEPTDPGPDESPIVGAQFVRIAQQPVDVGAAPGQTATFTAGVSSSGSPTFQWQKAAPGSSTFADVPGANATSYTTPPTTAADNGTTYRLVASFAGQTATSRAAKLITDVTSPTVVRAAGGGGFNTVTVTFSEPVSPATATNPANYSITGGLTISNIVVGAGGTSAILTTSKQTTNTSYTITINNVTDLVGNVVSPNPSVAKFSGFVTVDGGVLHKFFANVTGNTIASLTANARFPNSPSFITIEPLFEYPPNGGGEAGENYGNELSGLLTAPTTGDYVFFTCSDDPSNLYLSTDEDPANKHLIAVEQSWSNARQWVSSGGPSDITFKRSDQYPTTQWPTGNKITLTAGKRYYIEVLHTEGGGGDNVGVNWQPPGAAEPADGDPPIPGSAVSFNYNPDGTINITGQPQNLTVAANSPATFTIAATGVSDFGTNINYRWQKASAGSSVFTDITGATQASYNIPFAATADNGLQFRVAMGLIPPGLPIDNSKSTSSVATLTVTSDSTPPGIVSVSADLSTVTVIFTEPLDNASAGAKANYTIDGGVTVNSATVTSAAGAAGVVQLAITGAQAGKSYTLTVTGVKDVAGNVVAANTKATFIAYNIYATFDDGKIPTGATTAASGSTPPVVLPNGTGNTTPFLQITDPTGSQQGAIVFDDVLNGADVTKFTATFRLFIGKGSGNPADGFSFNLAPDISSDASISEEGIGSGLTIAMDTYDNGGGEAPAIDVKWAGQEVATTKVAKAVLVNNQWVNVTIQGSVDASGGHVTVIHNNVKYYDNLSIPDWAAGALAGAKLGLGARTGGEFEVHWLDDLKVIYNADVAIAQPPTISITSPTNNARLAVGASVPITVNAQAPGGTVAKVEFIVNGRSLGVVTNAPFTSTIPNAAQGAYFVSAALTDGAGVTVTSAQIKFVVGNPKLILFVTADPGPLSFAGDQAVLQHLLDGGFDVVLTRGSDVPDDGSTAAGKDLVMISSSLGSGTVIVTGGTDAKFLNVTNPVMEWEQALQDNFNFQADADPHNTVDGQTDINIVDASSPLAAGLSAGTHTVVTSPQVFSWGTPVNAHIVATISTNPAQAVIYYYEKGVAAFNGFVAPGRRAFFFFQDNTAAAANADAFKLFDAEMNWLLGISGGGGGTPVISVARSGDSLTISWTNNGTLESTPSLTPPVVWTTASSTSPFVTTTTSATTKFYRVRKP